MVGLRQSFLAVFVVGVLIYLWLERDRFEREGIVFLRRTQKGIDDIDRVAEKFPRLWKWYGNIAAFTGLVSIFAATAMIGQVFLQMLKTKSVENGPSLILPGAVSQNQFQAGVSFIPVEYWIAGIAFTVFFHELSHGIVARAENFDIKSVGYGFLAVIPIGFVEPEGDNSLEAGIEDPPWNSGTVKQRLKVLGAGSFANYLVAAVFLLAGVGISSAISQPSDVFYVAEEGFPAYESGMRNGTLQQINGERIDTVDDLRNVSETIEVGEPVSVWSSEGNFSMEAVSKQNHSGGYIGIRVGTSTVVKEEYQEYSSGLSWFTQLLLTVGTLNLLIGLFNMLPIVPLDGGLMVDSLLREYREKSLETFYRVSVVGWALILASIVLAIVAGF